ncbi:hypothetical protein EVAR_19366_1 [Eumeta japonica]|uniref:Uncharacterized protein n=1 Tax=Eumeta variegata TaxID=151549 RepID=A0A4C1TRH4_EUMVA|nr:hypothetical protein EVAR_19366_1 [Eumeta japonica]
MKSESQSNRQIRIYCRSKNATLNIQTRSLLAPSVRSNKTLLDKTVTLPCCARGRPIIVEWERETQGIRRASLSFGRRSTRLQLTRAHGPRAPLNHPFIGGRGRVRRMLIRRANKLLLQPFYLCNAERSAGGARASAGGFFFASSLAVFNDVTTRRGLARSRKVVTFLNSSVTRVVLAEWSARRLEIPKYGVRILITKRLVDDESKLLVLCLGEHIELSRISLNCINAEGQYPSPTKEKRKQHHRNIFSEPERPDIATPVHRVREISLHRGKEPGAERGAWELRRYSAPVIEPERGRARESPRARDSIASCTRRRRERHTERYDTVMARPRGFDVLNKCEANFYGDGERAAVCGRRSRAYNRVRSQNALEIGPRPRRVSFEDVDWIINTVHISIERRDIGYKDRGRLQQEGSAACAPAHGLNCGTEVKMKNKAAIGLELTVRSTDIKNDEGHFAGKATKFLFKFHEAGGQRMEVLEVRLTRSVRASRAPRPFRSVSRCETDTRALCTCPLTTRDISTAHAIGVPLARGSAPGLSSLVAEAQQTIRVDSLTSSSTRQLPARP